MRAHISFNTLPCDTKDQSLPQHLYTGMSAAGAFLVWRCLLRMQPTPLANDGGQLESGAFGGACCHCLLVCDASALPVPLCQHAQEKQHPYRYELQWDVTHLRSKNSGVAPLGMHGHFFFVAICAVCVCPVFAGTQHLWPL